MFIFLGFQDGFAAIFTGLLRQQSDDFISVYNEEIATTIKTAVKQVSTHVRTRKYVLTTQIYPRSLG